MEPTPELIDALYDEEVERARQLPDEVKLLGPARLFDLACGVMADGIRAQHPGISDADVLTTVRERLRLARELEQST